jgi:hypothetical protein
MIRFLRMGLFPTQLIEKFVLLLYPSKGEVKNFIGDFFENAQKSLMSDDQDEIKPFGKSN